MELTELVNIGSISEVERVDLHCNRKRDHVWLNQIPYTRTLAELRVDVDIQIQSRSVQLLRRFTLQCLLMVQYMSSRQGTGPTVPDYR